MKTKVLFRLVAAFAVASATPSWLCAGQAEDESTIRAAVAFPGLDARVRSTGSSGAGELFGFAVDTVEIFIWGTPIVRAIAEAALTGLEMRAAAEARI